MTQPLLEVDALALGVPTRQGWRRLLRDVTFSISPGEAVGLVGESGSGKSLTARAALGLLPAGAVATGRVVLDGIDVLRTSPPALRRLRGGTAGMIFQDARAHIDPVRSVGDHIVEPLRLAGISRRDAELRAVEVLEAVMLDTPRRLLRRYPHQLSGGMLQRVMIAGALIASPRLLLADEPTSALDPTTQAEVMAILAQLRRERGVAVLFITHDLELAATTTDRTVVMYAGAVVETSTSDRLLTAPQHPYTRGLAASRPTLHGPVERLAAIGGRPIAAHDVHDSCAFADRCRLVLTPCREEPVPLRATATGAVACLRADDVVVGGAG